MNHKDELEKLHKESLSKFEDYLSHKRIVKEDHEKLHQAKKDWEVAWNRLMEAILVLEHLEI